ncbi:MAG: DUF4331 family protein [Bacteroidota bacterium]
MSKRASFALASLFAFLALGYALWQPTLGDASSHRESPLILEDPLADNTDLYAFRSPDNPETVTIIANYIPFELPSGGPNYHSFGENIRYEIHVDNNVETPGDDIVYRFTFRQENEDPTTFFNIRLGQQNLKTLYTLEKITADGALVIEENGVVAPNNIGPRSIEDATVGLGTTYDALREAATISIASSDERVFVGPVDDPFFVDLGGIFDLGNVRMTYGEDPADPTNARDEVAGFNTHAIALQIPISTLQKDGKSVDEAENILDSDFVIGVWASASRPQMRMLSHDGEKPTYSGDWIQVSRLGMPLTNEVVIPIGDKDEWNARTPYNENPEHYEYFYNPELGLYMDDDLFGGAVPGFSNLRIQRNSLGSFDFGNGQDGLFGLKGSDAVAGTALDAFGDLLLPAAGKPRSVDLWPAFHTGVPNVVPYQLATGKEGNPLAEGKPFVNNFLPNGGDMLRLNMAVPPTPRDDPDFNSLGLLQAAVLGLTDARFNGSTDIEFIPNMDGFPNGRRLEDDVTRIELQAVSGVVLAAIGLWYDDFDPAASASPVTDDLVSVLTFNAGPVQNDLEFTDSFPYLANPHNGFSYVRDVTADEPGTMGTSIEGLGLAVPDAFIIDQNYPNPFNPSTTISYHVARDGIVSLAVYDIQGRLVDRLVSDSRRAPGTYEVNWDAANMPSGTYFYQLTVNGNALPAKKAVLLK